MALDITSYALGKKAGGGTTPTGTINITENGTTNVTNYATANVNVQPDLESKELTITSNTTTNITPTSGKDGLSSVSVITNVQPNLETKSITITENKTTTITPTSGKDGLSSVEVITNVSGGDDWSDIGYSSTPAGIDSIHAYSKSVYDNWNPSSPPTKIGNSGLLVICPNVDVSNVNKFQSFFESYSSLIQIPALNVTVKSSYKSLKSAFSYCSFLVYADFSNWNTQQANSMQQMFYSCSNLASVDLSSFNTSNVTTTQGMFASCTKLTNINLSSWDASNITDVSGMFNNCISLTTINFGNNFNLTKATTLTNMFASCTKLDNDTLNQILHLCTTATSYTGTKTLGTLGIDSSFVNYANIPNLSNYQAFLDAGWTIS